MTSRKKLLLASASPRRQQLLHQIGVDFILHPVDICEQPRQNELPIDYVKRLAEEKARQALSEVSGEYAVLGADTTVVQQGQIMGKPENKQHAADMLRALSNSSHRVLTAVCLLNNKHIEAAISETKVYFKCLNENEISRYWDTGEPQDKAGGYAIQGKGAIFISKIEGSYSGVVGLPLTETCHLLEQFSLPWWCKK